MRVTAYGSKINMHGCKSHYNYNSFRPWPCARISGHEAPTHAVTRTSRSSATGSIAPGGTFLH